MNIATCDFYDLLQISERASPSEIRAAYRRAALICHPDKGGTSENFQLLVRAFETLSDDHRRKSYNIRRGRRKHGVARAGESVPGGSTQASSAEERDSKGRSSFCQESKGAAGCASGGQRGSTTGGEKYSISRRLQISLERLRRAMQRVPAGRRRDLIDTLDCTVKVRLLKWMEVRAGEQESDFQVMPADLNSESETSSGASENSEFSCQASGETLAICNSDIEQGVESSDLRKDVDSVSRSCKRSGRHKRNTRGIETFTGPTGSVFYRACSSTSHLTFFTKSQPQLEVAVDHHIVLMQIRQTIFHLVDKGTDSIENIQLAVDEIIRTNRVSWDEMGLRAYARMYFRGSSLASPVLPFKDVLQWRCRMMQCKFATIDEFRDMCLELLQHPARKKHCTKEMAEAIVEIVIAKMRPHWGKFRSSKGFITGSSVREKRVRSAAAVVARDIKALFKEQAREARSCADREAQKRRKVELERHKWLHRKPAKDMTMEDFQQGLPRHLRP